MLEDAKRQLEQEVVHLRDQLSVADTKKQQELQVGLDLLATAYPKPYSIHVGRPDWLSVLHWIAVLRLSLESSCH